MTVETGWNDPTRVAEYLEHKQEFEAGTAVPWKDRQDYMTTMQRVTRVLTRAQDAAQAGGELPEDVEQALRDGAYAAKLYLRAVRRARG